MSGPILRRVEPSALGRETRRPVARETFERAGEIVESVRRGGEGALRGWAEELGDLDSGAPLIVEPSELAAALDRVGSRTRGLLERTADRIRAFAQAQRTALSDLEMPIPGGRAGHRVSSVASAGCYAPGGRFPLPSSLLMTGVTARAAGVERVWAASPRPSDATLAAAAVAGVDGLLAVGGAQAVAALALGVGLPAPCDVVAGPGNRWVTAAKKWLWGEVGLDLPAGPTELVVLADDSADPERVAADLLAQAEHDPEARAVLVTPSPRLLEAVETALPDRLAELETVEVARRSLAEHGFAVRVRDLAEGIEVCDRLAPEHLEVATRDAEAIARRCSAYGCVFVGGDSAEVLGDYGAGPNHTLPTGGAARFTGGLSVLSFLRLQTWLRIDDPAAAAGLARDAASLAGLEGLDGHRRAAEERLRGWE